MSQSGAEKAHGCCRTSHEVLRCVGGCGLDVYHFAHTELDGLPRCSQCCSIAKAARP